MQSIIKLLNNDAEEIKVMLGELSSYSKITKWNNNNSNSGIVIIAPPYKWGKLSDEGKQLQGRILKQYNRLTDMIKILIIDLPKQNLNFLEKTMPQVLEIIEQNKTLFSSSPQECLNKAIGKIDDQLKMLDGLYDSNPNTIIYVPDTNAILTNPNLEKWVFEEVEGYTVVLVPVVLSELDKLKIDGRHETLRDKAKSFIKKIKEYMRRGTISEGVKLSGKNKIKTIAVEPNFEKTLPWLDETNNDDRMIASYIEVVRQHPRSNVILVTADINMQNKAAFANAMFIDPPEIV